MSQDPKGLARKSRSRSQSEPVLPASNLPQKNQQQQQQNRSESGDSQGVGAGEDIGWTGSLRNFVWGIWNQMSPADTMAMASDVSDDEGGNNLSEYEEEVRRRRRAATGATPPISISGSSATSGSGTGGHHRYKTSMSPIVSPSGANTGGSRVTSPYLEDSDYGIRLVDQEGHDSKDFLMTEGLIGKLHSGLPSRWRVASEWRLIYSTNYHGFSLGTMFTRSRPFSTLPVLAVIKDSEGALFGAFVTEPFLPHIGHFGTGECFLWKLTDDGHVLRFRSTGANDYFMMCEAGYIAVGCGEGRFGLWLDDQFEHGHSHPVSTFNNDRPLASSENFECVAFELWGLVCEDLII